MYAVGYNSGTSARVRGFKSPRRCMLSSVAGPNNPHASSRPSAIGTRARCARAQCPRDAPPAHAYAAWPSSMCTARHMRKASSVPHGQCRASPRQHTSHIHFRELEGHNVRFRAETPVCVHFRATGSRCGKGGWPYVGCFVHEAVLKTQDTRLAYPAESIRL